MSIEAQEQQLNVENESSKEIPIKNIYYMLSYAYENLKINEDIKRDSEDFKNIYDLFGRIIVEGVNNLIKRGFYKEYITKNEDTANIRGKININESIKRQTRVYKKLNCVYDEFSENVLFNRIIITTINNLIRIPDLDKKIKKNLKKLTVFFSNVSIINLNKHVFNSFLWSRNNQHYRLLINISELVFRFELPDDSKIGEITFKKFIINYEREMANLFENFIYKYYKKERTELKVHKPEIKWNINENSHQTNFLPKMRTDVVLETKKYPSKQLIIDAKFYKDILSSNFDKKVLNSSNLYQIFSYVNNSLFEGKINGMLIYASLGEDLDIQYKIDNHEFLIKTLNLNQNWDYIENRLNEIANCLYND